MGTVTSKFVHLKGDLAVRGLLQHFPRAGGTGRACELTLIHHVIEPLRRVGRRHCARPPRGQFGTASRALRKMDWQRALAVLDVKHRVVACLLDHLGEVEIEHRVVLAVEHHEADGIAADLIDDLTQCYEVSGPSTFDRLARPQQAHELDDLDVELGPLVADTADRLPRRPAFA